MLAKAFGGVIIDADGRVLLREPTDHFDEYVWTFAKGRPDGEESGEDCALREVFEETGVRARIVRPIPGDFRGGTTVNRYFLMEPLEETGMFDAAETASVRWADAGEAAELIGLTTNSTGQARDLAVLAAALSTLGESQ